MEVVLERGDQFEFVVDALVGDFDIDLDLLRLLDLGVCNGVQVDLALQFVLQVRLALVLQVVELVIVLVQDLLQLDQVIPVILLLPQLQLQLLALILLEQVQPLHLVDNLLVLDEVLELVALLVVLVLSELLLIHFENLAHGLVVGLEIDAVVLQVVQVLLHVAPGLDLLLLYIVVDLLGVVIDLLHDALLNHPVGIDVLVVELLLLHQVTLDLLDQLGLVAHPARADVVQLLVQLLLFLQFLRRLLYLVLLDVYQLLVVRQ